MNRVNRIRFTRNRQNVCFLFFVFIFLGGGGIILVETRAQLAVPGNQASKNWNGRSNMSELFTVDASSLALTSIDSSLPSVMLITEDPLSRRPKKATFVWPK